MLKSILMAVFTAFFASAVFSADVVIPAPEGYTGPEQVLMCRLTPRERIRSRLIEEDRIQRRLARGDWFAMPYFADYDGDGFGNPDMAHLFCSEPDSGYSLDDRDCDDTDADKNPLTGCFDDGPVRPDDEPTDAEREANCLARGCEYRGGFCHSCPA